MPILWILYRELQFVELDLVGPDRPLLCLEKDGS